MAQENRGGTVEIMGVKIRCATHAEGKKLKAVADGLEVLREKLTAAPVIPGEELRARARKERELSQGRVTDPKTGKPGEITARNEEDWYDDLENWDAAATGEGLPRKLSSNTMLALTEEVLWKEMRTLAAARRAVLSAESGSGSGSGSGSPSESA